MRYLAPLVVVALLALPARAVEDWKGKPYPYQFSVGVLGGVGIFDGVAGASLPVTLGTKILNKGFVPDINDQVWMEAEVGPFFAFGGTGAQWSAHLRWDFNKNDDMTFYALGGLGGLLEGGHNELFPRFGVGAIWYLWETVALRAELSHELIAAGIHIAF